jgi:threonine/homoserine/homoserine lactone efflux protein
VGGFLLLYLAYQTATSAPVQAATVKSSHLYWSTVALTITNPATIIVFLGLFAGNTGISTPHGLAVWELVAGVGLGSALWWLLLASISAYVGRAMNATNLVWVNRISGVVIGAFGVVAIGSYFS